MVLTTNVERPSGRRSTSRTGILAGLLAVLILACGWGTATAEAAPTFTITTTKKPGTVRVGDKQVIYQAMVKTSEAIPAGSGVTVAVHLPPGMVSTSVPPPSGPSVTCSSSPIVCVQNGAMTTTSTLFVNMTLRVDDGAVDQSAAEITVSGGTAGGTNTLQDPFTVAPRWAFGIHDFVARTLDPSGAPDAVAPAGGHPFAAEAAFVINRSVDENGLWAPIEPVKTIVTDLPVGFVGNPQTTVKCVLARLAFLECPVESQVGVLDTLIDNRVEPSSVTPAHVGVYNMVSNSGDAAELAASINGIGIVRIRASVRSDDDYGVRLTTVIPGEVAQTPEYVRVKLWGTPADPRHNPDRFICTFGILCVGGATTTAAQVPFLSNPHECLPDPPVTKLSVDSWMHPGKFTTYESVAAPVVDCDKPTFDPSVDIQPTTSAPDAPSGLNVDLAFPQDGLLAVDGLAPPPLKKAVVTLPEGMTINPSAADGLTACSDDELNLKSKAEVKCPESSKVGAVTAKSPLLEETLSGGVYIRSQNSMDPQSGEMFRLALVLENKERGLSVRLPGSIVADKDTGRLVTTFDNNPQLPVSDINLRFKDGPRAPLATPPTCGAKTIDTTLTSWGGQSVDRQSTFTVDCAAGLGAFSPMFSAGAVDPLAGGSSPFDLRIDRTDGQDVLAGVKVDLPGGLLAVIKGNLGSQVGDVDVAAGPGSQPFWLKGKVYIEGRYEDAPFSLRVVVPAKAGPFDLGEVVVRQKLYVDKHDAHVTVVSDPVPIVVKGVPVRLRTLNVSVNKPGFMRNPSSCAVKQVGGTLTGAGGFAAPVSSRFQVGGCEHLPFNPVFSAQSDGQLAFKKGASLKVHMSVPAGDANIASVETTLPKELPSRLIPTIRNACVMEQYLADYTKCPQESFIGTVSAVTPLLEEPLKGPAYIVAPPNDVPRVELKLFGQGSSEGVQVDLEGDVIVDVGDGRSKVTFKTVPDVPVTSFDVDFPAGDHSILDAPSYDTCKGPIQMLVRIVGQNGKVDQGYRTVKVTDCPKYKKAKITGAKVTKTGVSLRVKPPVGDGRMTVTGNGLTPIVRKVDRRWTYSVRVPMSAAGKRALARKGSLKTRLTVVFKPTNSSKSTKVRTKTLTITTTKKKTSHKRTVITRTLW